MILNVFITLLPTIFLINFFQTEYRLHKKGIELAGSSPINNYIFIGTKYLLVLVWIGMILDMWNIHIPGTLFYNKILQNFGIGLWIIGFLFLYIGRFSLGKSFRMGVANEKTEFVAKGIYRLSRNPMYLGLFLTFIGGSLFSMNLIYILLSIIIIIVHHFITLAEEKKLLDSYGEPYKEYCKQVRRYI